MNLKQKLFWNILTICSVIIVFYMLYSTYSLNTELSTFEKRLAQEEVGSDTELRTMIAELEKNYSGREVKFKMKDDPTNLGRALKIPGLEDYYLTLAKVFPKVKVVQGLNANVTYHEFRSDVGGVKFGTEWDASLSFKTKKVGWLVKYANYNADRFGVDRQILWLQAEVVF